MSAQCLRISGERPRVATRVSVRPKGSLGANTLIALRAFTGLTIDELLGLEPISGAAGLSARQLETMLEQVLARVKK